METSQGKYNRKTANIKFIHLLLPHPVVFFVLHHSLCDLSSALLSLFGGVADFQNVESRHRELD